MYRAEVASVYAFLFRLGAPKSDLPDLTHDVFAAAIARWTSFDRARPVRPWLLGIAWRTASDWRQKKRPELWDVLPDQADEANPDASLEARDAQRLLHDGLSKLDEAKRVAFVMHELNGLSVKDVASAMDAPLQTTYSRLRMAREELAIAVRRLQRGAA